MGAERIEDEMGVPIRDRSEIDHGWSFLKLCRMGTGGVECYLEEEVLDLEGAEAESISGEEETAVSECIVGEAAEKEASFLV